MSLGRSFLAFLEKLFLMCKISKKRTQFRAFIAFSIGKMYANKIAGSFQSIEFSLSKFDSLDPTYQTSKARIRQVGKDPAILSAYILPIENTTEERSYDRFFFSHAKKQVLFFKNTQNQRAKLIFDRILAVSAWFSIRR